MEQNVYVARSNISGDGVFAKWKLCKNLNLGRYSPNSPLQECKEIDPQFYYYGLKVKIGNIPYLIDGMDENGDVDTSAKINHSFNPNVKFLQNGDIVTLRKIHKDEELLADYGTDYWLHLFAPLKPENYNLNDERKWLFQAQVFLLLTPKEPILYYEEDSQDVKNLNEHDTTNIFSLIQHAIDQEKNNRKYKIASKYGNPFENFTCTTTECGFKMTPTNNNSPNFSGGPRSKRYHSNFGGKGPRYQLACKAARKTEPTVGAQKKNDESEDANHESEDETSKNEKEIIPRFKKQRVNSTTFCLQDLFDIQIINELISCFLHYDEMLYLTCQWQQIDDPCETAITLNRMDLLIWGFSNSNKQTKGLCQMAAAQGNLKMLKYLRSMNCQWTSIVINCALRRGHVDLVKWAIYNGCEFNAYALLSQAIEKQDFYLVKWAASLQRKRWNFNWHLQRNLSTELKDWLQKHFVWTANYA